MTGTERERTNDPRHLAGRHAVVTGGGHGIGGAVATSLARLGAKLTLMGRDLPRLEAHASRLTADFRVPAAAVVCDVSREDAVEAAFAATRAGLGEVHVLVNNAGVGESAPLAETSKAMWDRAIGVNLTGTFLCCRAVVEEMSEAGWGRIVNIASTAGLQGHGRITAYSASKHGVVGFTRALGRELAKHGVTVNAVCPSYTDTAMAERAVRSVATGTGRSDSEARRMLERALPIGRLVAPEEVASLVAWLCSPEAAAVTATALPIAGGEVG